MEKIQVTAFAIQEFIISGLYVYETRQILKPGETFHKKRTRRVMRHLIYVNILIIIIHLMASGLMMLFILLHAGRGGGLSDMFGGASGGSMAGSTVVERNLDRITVATAIVFGFTTVLLALRLKT